MRVEEIISPRKSTVTRYTVLTYSVFFIVVTLTLFFLIKFVMRFEEGNSQLVGFLTLATAMLIIIVGAVLFAKSRYVSPYLETITNIEKAFNLKYIKTIQGDLASTRDQTIIFAGVKDNKYSNFTITIKEGVSSIYQHNSSNYAQLTSNE